ncbi:PREDICTED: uncharacterized protein LOC109580209 [Amphimedon queenslandica]|uniref:Uncharacterized protein n=1 Tax=Amphimedon queenslandica TaxID=400682 RepID=A0AAN0IVD8_AMPQE|nr:PREDICTED: uncharacterized protein LOC109580209 [Amphimedon queenslandica]|eukprot:XP_019848699.1 PREDICTED: uncharacterized protein LOC109580209 [Amphimedon queenslandica]
MLLLNKLIKNLSEDQRIMVNKDIIPFKLSCTVLLEHLCDDETSIMKCVLTLWTTIFSNNEQNTVCLKDYIAGSQVRTFQVLAFTLINLMADEREELGVEAVKCFQALCYHVSSDSSNISFELIICSDWLELLYSFFSIRYTDNLPLHFKELKNHFNKQVNY